MLNGILSNELQLTLPFKPTFQIIVSSPSERINDYVLKLPRHASIIRRWRTAARTIRARPLSKFWVWEVEDDPGVDVSVA